MRVKLKQGLSILFGLVLIGTVVFIAYRFSINDKRVAVELENAKKDKATIPTLDNNLSTPAATGIPDGKDVLESPVEIAPPPTPKLPKEEQPIIIDAAFGLTKETNGDLIVGLYDLRKTSKGYQRYFSYRCDAKDSKLVKFDTGAYFVFGRSNGVMVRDITVDDKTYYTTEGDGKDIVKALNRASSFSFSVPSGTVYKVTVHDRSENDLPCL
jgi:hypothetical protein|nr:MAG TPA: hypothetical protein [Caudoviricetes sp.]